MTKVYCEHGAISASLRAYRREGHIELVHFPYDPNSRSKHLKRLATPSRAQWKDMHVRGWDELTRFEWSDFRGSVHFKKILAILGGDKRRDALHIDSAYKEGCELFVTCDNDILSKKNELELLVDIRFLDPGQAHKELETRFGPVPAAS